MVSEPAGPPAFTDELGDDPPVLLAAGEPPAPSKFRQMLHSARIYAPDLIRYLYLMRFSLLLWLSMLALAWVDTFTSAASITRGILTPFSPEQYFFTGVAVVLPGWFALLAARIVCAYGQDRFEITPPPWFQIVDRMEWFAFWGAQIPGVALLARIAYNVVHEGETRGYIVVVPCLIAGAFVALLFWYVISILYYWVWDPDCAIPVKAFLVPHWEPLPIDEIQSMPSGSSLHHLSHATELLRRLGPGYLARVPGRTDAVRTAPGHVVATIAFVCAIVLYFILMPISAPVTMPTLVLCGRTLSLILLLHIVFQLIVPAAKGLAREHVPEVNNCGCLEANSATGVVPVEVTASRKPSVSARAIPLAASLIALLPALLGLVSPQQPHLLPVIAYVVILLMVLFWTLAGVAFFADHYRVPVLTLAVLAILLINHWPAEHVFPTNPLPDALARTPLPTPAEFVNRIAFSQAGVDQPVVIITATGGGIHAAQWTATVLRSLEEEFGKQQIPLQSHILLMSSVSGGSVATAGFLREYFTDRPFDSDSFDRLQGMSGCSSLQAVAWGLAYPDTLRLFFPYIFNLFPSLDRFDRGWALQYALDRNLHDKQCITTPSARGGGGPSLAALTLNDLTHFDQSTVLCKQHADACAHFPAFTLNTTVVETGDRFLLSNYSVFVDNATTESVLPAASFLGVYGRDATLPLPLHPRRIDGRGGYADLPLMTAARLSASFTYVSPAARLPFEQADSQSFQNAFHFVDGGYYDNDGTSSVIEFLKAAADGSASTPASAGSQNSRGPFNAQHRLRVLLIEIRNGNDINANDSPDAYASQAGMQWDNARQTWYRAPTDRKRRYGPTEEILAPPEAAYNAGFGSTTARNRRELDTLKAALGNSMDLQRVVLDYKQEIRKDAKGRAIEGESELYPPLSWHLSKRQREWISGANRLERPDHLQSADDFALDRKAPDSDSDRQRIRQAVCWFVAAQKADPARPVQPQCAANAH